jgi:GGDEF domain-containing protein
LIPLAELCSLLRALEQICEVDILGHFGERSFALLMPGVDLAQATVLVDRINQNLHDVNSNFPKPKLSIYFGLASAPADAMSLSALCDVARNSLQEAVGQRKYRI